MLKACPDQVLGTHFLVQLQRHAGELDLLVEVAQGFIKLFFTRHLFGDVELTTNLTIGIKKRHVQPAAGGGGGKGQTGRSCAHYRDALFAGRRCLDHEGLVAGAWVHQARRDLAAKGVVQACLVAANAGVDFIRPAFSRLLHKQRICQKWPRHADHVGHAIGQNLLGDLRGIDAVGSNQWNTHLALELLGDPGEGGAGHFGGDGGNAGFVPADTSVQDGDAGLFQRLRQLHYFFLGGAAFHQV